MQHTTPNPACLRGKQRNSASGIYYAMERRRVRYAMERRRHGYPRARKHALALGHLAIIPVDKVHLHRTTLKHDLHLETSVLRCLAQGVVNAA